MLSGKAIAPHHTSSYVHYIVDQIVGKIHFFIG